MYNEPHHLVSVFKDYLIFDDFSEYIKRFYHFQDSQHRLVKIYDFYIKYSKIFPSYASIPIESKFMF